MPNNTEGEIHTILRNFPELREFDQNNFASGLAPETRRTQFKAARSFLLGARKARIKGVPKTIEQVREAFAAARNLNGEPYDQATYRNVVMYVRKFYRFLGREDMYEAFEIPRLTEQRLITKYSHSEGCSTPCGVSSPLAALDHACAANALTATFSFFRSR